MFLRERKIHEINKVLLGREGQIEVECRPRYNGICDSRWRASGNCNPCNRSLSPKTARALGRNRKWHEFVIKNTAGQASVEFALILGVLIAIVVGLGAFLDKANAGVFIDHAIAASSHNITNSIKGLVDVFLY